VIKALALGAKGAMLGRAHLYGLGAMGQAGVAKALEIIATEMDLTLALCGHTNVQDIDRSILLPGTYSQADWTCSELRREKTLA
jgi:L-lactate dehydrogenase (cytochrome)